MSSTGNTNPGNFANRPKEEVIEIAKKGGQASHGGHGGGSTSMDPDTTTGNTNPGNFANRPKEEVSEIAKKGGQASHKGGFASMDPERQVITPLPSSSRISRIDADNCYRRKLHPWAERPLADRLRRAVRRPRMLGVRVDRPLEG